MLKRPPQHGADAPILYVHEDDDAWNRERVKREQDEMKARGEDPAMHPFARYHGGWTRYHIDAPATVSGERVTVRDYLDESKQPTIWKLRRLSWDQWYEIQPLFEKAIKSGERPFTAYLRACAVGIERVENGPALDGGLRLSTSDVEKLYEINQELPFDIGCAVYQASLPLSETEGKR